MHGWQISGRRLVKLHCQSKCDRIAYKTAPAINKPMWTIVHLHIFPGLPWLYGNLVSAADYRKCFQYITFFSLVQGYHTPIIRFIIVHFSLSLFLSIYVYNFVLICVLFYSVYFMSLFCVSCICVFFDPAFGYYTAINVCVSVVYWT